MKWLITTLMGVYFFTLPWDGFFLSTLNLPVSASYIFVALAAIIYFVISIGIECYISLPKFFWPLALLLIYSSITLAWTPILNSGLFTVIILWSYLLSFILIYTMVKRVNLNIYFLLWCYILGAISVGAYSWLVGNFTLGRLAYAEGANPSYFAAFLALAVIAAVAVLPKVKTTGSIFVMIIIVFIITLLLLTQGRNSIIALCVSFPIALMTRYISIDLSRFVVIVKKISLKVTSQAFIVFMVIILLTVSILFITGLHKELNRVVLISELVDGDIDRATAGRGSIWANYKALIYPTAALGGGVRSAGYLYQVIYGNHRSPHNVFILIWVEYGMFGFFLWLVFIIGFIKYTLFYLADSFTAIWLAFFILLLGIGNDVLYYKYWWIGLLLYLLLAADVKMSQRKNYNYDRLRTH